MKYIKLFEQFEDDEDSWWEKESPYEKDLQRDLIIVFLKDNKRFYLAKKRKESYITYIDRFDYPDKLNEQIYQFDFIKPKLDDIIRFYDKNGIYDGLRDSYSQHSYGWKYFLYKDLPKELKNRIRE